MDGHIRIEWIVLMLPYMFKTGQVYQKNVWIDKITLISNNSMTTYQCGTRQEK